MSSRSGPVVVLDLDDNVFSERQYAVSGFKAVGDFVQRQFGIRGFAETSIALFESGVRGKVFDRACLELKLPTSETLISALVQIYRAHWPSIELFADARAFLRSLEGAVLSRPVGRPLGFPGRQGRRTWNAALVFGSDFHRRLGAGRLEAGRDRLPPDPGAPAFLGVLCLHCGQSA
jgi:hypothetical protein